MSAQPPSVDHVAGDTPPITWLYIPGDRPDRIGKAIASTADVVIVDLEDSVAPAHKALARDAALAALTDPQHQGRALEVRINGIRSTWGRADLAAIRDVHREGATFGVRVPKVESRTDVLRVVDALGTDDPRGITCLVESAVGVEHAFDIASAHPHVIAIGLGEADLASDLGVHDEAGLSWARSRIVNAARAAGLRSPAMSAWLRVTDLDGLAASCRAGRALGFLGRTAIHPAQLPVIEAAFMPSGPEVAAAQELLDVLVSASRTDQGGAILPDGRFIDRALIGAAMRTLTLVRRHPSRS